MHSQRRLGADVSTFAHLASSGAGRCHRLRPVPLDRERAARAKRRRRHPRRRAERGRCEREPAGRRTATYGSRRAGCRRREERRRPFPSEGDGALSDESADEAAPCHVPSEGAWSQRGEAATASALQADPNLRQAGPLGHYRVARESEPKSSLP